MTRARFARWLDGFVFLLAGACAFAPDTTTTRVVVVSAAVVCLARAAWPRPR